MTTSSDLVQISVVAENVYGVTPTNPAFVVIRTTGEGLAFAPTTVKSSEMNPARQVTDSILTGGTVSGNLNFELAHETWFDQLLAGAFCADWQSDLLKVGTAFKSFTVEKRIPVPGGVTQYHRYAGCTVNGFSFDIKPNAIITGSFTLLGKGVTTGEDSLPGATYSNPYLNPIMTAPRVVGIEIGGVPAVAQCFNNLQLSMNNNNRAIECIGTLGAKELALGRCEITATFGVLFNDSTLLKTLLDQVETSLRFQTNDSLQIGSPSGFNSFTWTIPRVKFTSNPVVAGGTNQDVVNTVAAEGLLDTIAGTALQCLRSPMLHNVFGVPRVTSPSTTTATVGTPFSYQISATGVPNSYGADNLPNGLSVNPATGTITGTPTSAATVTINVSATNDSGSGSEAVQLTIVAGAAQQPSITSSLNATGSQGSNFSYTIVASHGPTSFNATGLPNGLTVDTQSGQITGVPTDAGTTSVRISASNSAGTDTETLSIGISAVSSLDTRPKFGVASAGAYADMQGLLNGMTDVSNASNGGRSGTFNLTTSAGNFGWVAVPTSAVGAGMHFFDGVGFGGWSGAGLAGNNGGASDDPTVSSVTFTDSNGTNWTFFRQDYVNANPSPGAYTLS